MKNALFVLFFFQVSSLLFANGNYPAPTDIVRQYFAAVDAGNSAEVAKLLADDATVSTPLAPMPVDKKTWLGVALGFKTAFPDLQHDVASYTESGYTVVARGVLRGQNNGSLMGNPPTGNRVNTPFNTIFEMDKSWKIKVIYGQFDLKTFEAQLMAGLPDPVAAAEATVRAAYGALNRKDWEGFVALCDEKNYRDVGVAPEPLVGARVAVETYKQFLVGFPDLNFTINEVAQVNPKRYLVRLTLTGTNTGPLMGIPPTGKQMRYDDVDIVEFDAAGKLTYHEPSKGGPEVFRQLGIDLSTLGNKQAALNIMQTLDKRDLNGVTAAFAPGCQFHGWTPETLDVNGYKQAMSALIASFPDARFHVEDVVTEGDKVVVRHRFEGTHTGAAFQGFPTSNRRAIASATVSFQFKDGKPVELWLNADFLGIMAQIGALPAPGK